MSWDHPQRRDVLKGTAGGLVGASLLSTTPGVRAAQGDQKWRFDAEGEVVASPTIVDGKVYVGTKNTSGKSYVYKIDATSGDEEWKYELPESGENVETAVNVRYGTVYVGSSHIRALDAATGQEQWKYEIGSAVKSAPTVVSGTVYGASTDQKIFAVNATDGTESWVYDKPTSAIRASPTVKNDSVYIAAKKSTNDLISLNADTGTEEWTFTLDGKTYSSPTVSGSTVYVGAGGPNDDTSKLYAVDIENGTENWNYIAGGGIYSSPTEFAGSLYFGTLGTQQTNGKVYAVTDFGTKDWEFETGGDVISSPTVSSDTVLVGSNDSKLYAFDYVSGDKLWEFQTDGPVKSSPTIDLGIAYVGGGGYLYAVETLTNRDSTDSRVALGTLGHNNIWDNTYPDKKYNFEISVKSATVTQTDDVEVSASVTNYQGDYAADATAELLVDTNDDGQFEDSEVVTSTTVSVGGSGVRQVKFTYKDVGLQPGTYDMIGRVSLDGESGKSEPVTLTVEEPAFDWRFKAAGTPTSPTVVDGSAYIGTTAGDPTNYVYKVDTATGEKEWEHEPDGDINSVREAVNVQGGKVFVGTNNVEALDAETGNRLWKKEIGAIISAPTALGDTVYAASFDNKLYALNVETGEQRWVFEATKPIDSAPTVKDGSVYLAAVGDFGYLYSINADTGNVEWKYKLKGTLESSPTVANGTAYVGAGSGGFTDESKVHAVDIQNGTEAWTYDTGGGGVTSSPTVYDGTVFVGDYGTDSRNGMIYALDASNGDKLWSFETKDDVNSSPTVADGTVLYADSTKDGLNDIGYVVGLDASNGDELSRFETESSIRSSPTVVDGVVYFGDGKNFLYALPRDVTGKSQDSRVNLGTLGHHDVWANKGTGSQGPFDFDVNVDQDATVTKGKNVDITVSVSNNADEKSSGVIVELLVDSNGDDQYASSEAVASKTREFAANGSQNVQLTYENVQLDPAKYDYRGRVRRNGQTINNASDGVLTVVEQGQGPPPVVGDTAPTDPDNDGLYEDINGDETFDIFDVQALFDNLDSDPVQNNPEAFNFSGAENPTDVTIFDVQALFEEL